MLLDLSELLGPRLVSFQVVHLPQITTLTYTNMFEMPPIAVVLVLTAVCLLFHENNCLITKLLCLTHNILFLIYQYLQTAIFFVMQRVVSL